MNERTINLTGKNAIYIEKNHGYLHISNNLIEEISTAFRKGSYELHNYTPSIKPSIPREEVNLIQDWIEQDTTETTRCNIGILYGKAGIGKSIVMHHLLEELQNKENYLVLGLKSDQIEFANKDELEQILHLTQPLEIVIQQEAQKYKRVVILIDQIDALSLSLSSNRTPLRSLLKLTNEIQLIPNVRVVISCRPYDLEYDHSLNNLQTKNRWKLKELSSKQVKLTLQSNQCYRSISDKLLSFLGSPLHLYLFLKIKPYEQLRNIQSTDILYHELWRKYINEDCIGKVDKSRLLALIDTIVDKMYQRQELFVHLREVETNYIQELHYLLTNDFLIVTNSNQIQFFHQTLFDYVYARRFLEKGKDFLFTLRQQHQGLFSRASVKNILTFLREQNPFDYIQTLKHLLYDQNEAGLPAYRFHLKSLALSNLAYFETPLPSELNLIEKSIFSDTIYMGIIFESIYTANWFKEIWHIIKKSGGWKNLSKEYKEKAIIMCRRTLHEDSEMVLDSLNAVLDYENQDDYQTMNSILQYASLNYESDKLISLYKKFVKNKNPIEYTNLLSHILKEKPTFVCEELKKDIQLQLKEKKLIDKIETPHNVASLYNKLLDRHHKVGIKFLIEALTIVFEATQLRFEEYEILNSTALFCFSRETGKRYIDNFVEDAINILIDNFLQSLEDAETLQHIKALSRSEHKWFVFITLYIYTARPQQFTTDIYEIIMSRQVLANAPTWIKYQALQALHVSFVWMTDKQRKSLLDRILSIHDYREHLFQKERREWCLKYNHPFLDIDLHKGRAFNVLPIDELKRLSWKAYQECLRINRKFPPNWLKNEQPSSCRAYVGWRSLDKEKGYKMSPRAWLDSMLQYTTDNTSILDEKPSLTGQCHLFREVVSKKPENFIGLIYQIISEKQIPLTYPQAGMLGLLDAGRQDDAMLVMKAILDNINNDVNSTQRGFCIRPLLLDLLTVVNQDKIPRIIVQLLCNTLINAKEVKEDNQRDTEVHNVGVNQPRGYAGYSLVKCGWDSRYKEEIFQTIESVAQTASVYTRAAILCNMAILCFLDQNRSVSLFKQLIYDYDERLMAMPVSNLNPLVYFVKYALEDMMEYLQHAAKYPQCYPKLVITLWIAWLHNDRDERVKVLLDNICNTNQEARVTLLQFVQSFKEEIYEEAIVYILYLMSPHFDSQEMGKACDNMFRHIADWPNDYQDRITETYINSPLCKHQVSGFIHFLGGYATKNPIQTLKWLAKILEGEIYNEYDIWNSITDVVIQSYNSIRLFHDSSFQDSLEFAMDLIDTIMQHPNKENTIFQFINKLDNE